MDTKLIDGKEIASWIKNEVQVKLEAFRKEKGITPGLAVIIVGDNPASKVYVRNKIRACKKLGFLSENIRFEEDCSTEQILTCIDTLNSRQDIHGILVQLPLPDHLNKKEILGRVAFHKDVDGFHPVNIGRLVKGDYQWAPCTPSGIMKIFEYFGITVSGKDVVILGRSDIVGKPMALMLLHAHATVTICHSRTNRLADVAKRADILISAMGKPGLVDANFVKAGAIVIDVGTSRIEQNEAWPELNEEGSVWQKSFAKKGYAVVGDVRFQQLLGIAEYITPVPGGVGPLTIAMLLYNTVTAAEHWHDCN
ncbi:bifunctional methylenetetrahydrofolate dehydrogenase/methenyltetrahydrofolate cyclohydrolase FolD [candidate division CSSED10-310 bacterium]|uniref:Bifunctional protein FolD n=1 Tax=candidate division CSSED10-310 bacterium TaxID=2855610 RepID=A0ABV6YSH3_UNCC1